MSSPSDINASGSADFTGSVQNNPYGVGTYQIPTPSAASVPTPTTTAGLPSDVSGADTGMATATQGMPATGVPETTGAAAASSTGGLDFNSILSDIGSFLSSPTVSSAALIGLGEYEASQAQKTTGQLTSQLTGPSQNFVSAGVTELQQTMQGLTGTPVTSGSIGQQEQAAQNLGNIATQYSTGKLTDAQNQQVQQYVQSQQQQIRQQLANQGITDSSVIAMYDQQIQNNAAQLTQSLIEQNTTLAGQALTQVQSTYSNLLNQSISTFGAGMGPIEDAVQLTIQQNTQIANGLQQLFGQIARGFSGASGGSAGGSSAVGSALNSVIGTIGKYLTGTSGSTAGAAAGSIPLTNISGLGDLGSSSASLGDITMPDINFGPDAAGGAAAADAGLSASANEAIDSSVAAYEASSATAGAGTTAAGSTAAAADTGASTGAGFGAIAGPAIGIGEAALLAYEMGQGPSASEQFQKGTAAYNEGAATYASTLFTPSSTEDMMAYAAQYQGLSQSDPLYARMAPTGQQYANLPANFSGEYGNEGGTWYLPSANGTVQATQEQYQTISQMFYDASIDASGGAKAASSAGSETKWPDQEAMQKVYDYINSLPTAPAGFSLSPNGPASSTPIPTYDEFIQQSTDAQQFGQAWLAQNPTYAQNLPHP